MDQQNGLTTNQGFNVLALLLGVFELGKAKIPDDHAEAFVYVMTACAIAVMWFTRGHEALPNVVDEPTHDVDHDLPLDDVLAEARGFVSIPARAVSQRGLNLIKEFEGCRLKAYWDKWGKVWTIGYGWTIGVKKGDVWTQDKADQMLASGVIPFAKAVSDAIGSVATTQNQFDAMVSLCYNIGPANFRKSSVLRYHRAGSKSAAAQAFKAWNKAGGKVLPGLNRRRESEARLYAA